MIGSGAFVANGEALKMAGPSGLLIAILFIGIIAICTMESLSELVQLFPAPNAIVEYVAHFVDEDLSWLIGFAYWYSR